MISRIERIITLKNSLEDLNTDCIEEIEALNDEGELDGVELGYATSILDHLQVLEDKFNEFSEIISENDDKNDLLGDLEEDEDDEWFNDDWSS